MGWVDEEGLSLAGSCLRDGFGAVALLALGRQQNQNPSLSHVKMSVPGLKISMGHPKTHL